MMGEMDFSVDLGGRRIIKKKNFEDWSGERFHMNSIWIWVSRS